MALTDCDECGEEISTKAGECPNCGYPMNGTSSTTNDDDTVDSIRKGTSQTEVNKNQAGCLASQLFLVSTIIGILSQSWLIGGGAFIAGIIFISTPYLAGLVGLVLGLMWGGLGWAIGMGMESTGASVVFAFFGFAIGFGSTKLGSKYYREGVE